MVKWAGINLSVIPSDGKPTPYCTELHGFSTPTRGELHALWRQPCYINKNLCSMGPLHLTSFHYLLVCTCPSPVEGGWPGWHSTPSRRWSSWALSCTAGYAFPDIESYIYLLAWKHVYKGALTFKKIIISLSFFLFHISSNNINHIISDLTGRFEKQ